MTNGGWTYENTVGTAETGISLLEFYTHKYTHSSRQAWRERIQSGRIEVDGRPALLDAVLRPGQRLSYHRLPWAEPEVVRQIEIVKEDAELIAVNKPAGLPVLPGGQYVENTLLAMLADRYPERPDPVHRVGRGTSGLILLARSALARKHLTAELRHRRMRKWYLARIQGWPEADRWTVEQPIGKVEHQSLGYLHAAKTDGRAARSHCRLLHRYDGGQSLVEVEIPTGRPHQIRIHLAACGFPLVGDPLYGCWEADRGVTPGGPTPKALSMGVVPGDGGYHLHAARLEFIHPGTGALTAIACPPPGELRTGVTEPAPDHQYFST